MTTISNLPPGTPVVALRELRVHMTGGIYKGVKAHAKGKVVRQVGEAGSDIYFIKFDDLDMEMFCEYGEDIGMDGTAYPLENDYDRREDFDDGDDTEEEDG